MDNNQNLLTEIENRIESHNLDLLLFDIFDTIILRKVHPEYVKKIFSRKLKEYYLIDINSEELYQYRFDIEASLCRENEKNGFDLEFRFEDFCEKIYKKLQAEKLFKNDIVYDDFLKKCKKFEIESELLTQKVDPEIIKIVKYAYEKNIPVYALSDFYLSKEMLEILFQKHNIREFFTDLFVSSEYLIAKRSGRLYEKVLTEQFSQSQNIVMIGDNAHSDYEMAKRYSIDAFLIDRTKQRDFYQSYESDVLPVKKFHQKIESIINDSYESASPVFFKEMAFTLYYFIYRLYLEALSTGKKDIFFLSREGEFLKKLFDTFLKVNNIENIRSHYLIVSRKSTFIASLKALDQENFETLFRQYRKMSVQTFLKSLNFTQAEIDLLAKNKKWNLDAVQEDLPTSDTFSLLLEDHDFQNMYENKRSTQKAYLKCYINSFGADIDSEGLTLVDAGWKGTIQDHIFKLFDEKVAVNGYYLGLVTDLLPNERNFKKGLVFDYKHADRYNKVFEENMAIFEVLLGASHGSADHYTKNDTGQCLPVTHQEKEEAVIFEEIVSPLQEVIFTIFQKIAQAFMLSHVSVLDMREEVAKIHARMIYDPTKEEIAFFRQLYHFENFGVFEFSTFDKYKTDDFRIRVKYILQFLKNPKQFLSSTFWKAAALDDIGLLNIYLLYGRYQKIKMFRSLG